MTNELKKKQVEELEKEIDFLSDVDTQLLHVIDRILFLADVDCSKLKEAQQLINDFRYDMCDKYDLFEEES